MAKFSDLFGSIGSRFQILLGSSGVVLKAVSGALQVRNVADNADAAIRASLVTSSGGSVAIGSANLLTLQQSGSQSGALTITLPPNGGTAGFVLQTNGLGSTTWAANPGSTNQTVTDVTLFSFGSTSTIAAFTLPANAVVEAVRVYIDTVFAGGTSPTLSVGITGLTSKYAPSQDLTLLGCYEYYPALVPVGSAESIIVTYVPGGSSSGAGRVEVDYVIPS